MPTLVAIPGCNTRSLHPSPEDIRRGVEAIDGLAARILAGRVFGFLDPTPARAAWCQYNGLNTWLEVPEAWTGRKARCISWHWGVLWEGPDWYEIGWHPDEHYFALMPAWQHRLWLTLNKGKAPPKPTMRNPGRI